MEKKEVKMEKATKPKNEKLTYEQLENVCHQLSEQSRTLYQKLQEADMTNVFKRLDYLFAVIENAEVFEDYKKDDFLKNCIDEIVNSMTIPTEKPEEKDNKSEE